jgi:hypothetical protein
VLNHYYGRDSVVIGAYKGSGLSPSSPTLPYVEELVQNWPSPIKNTSQVPDAVDVYRKALTSQADHSVHISSIGIFTNLKALLESEPDHHSSLSGYELFGQKVKLLAVMGGKYPSSTNGPECNFCGCTHADDQSADTAKEATAYVVSHLPPQVQVVFSGFEVGYQVLAGARLSSCTPPSNPCRAAFISFEGGPNLPRYSWDPLSTLFAVRGLSGAYYSECSDCDGVNVVNSITGDNTWRLTPGRASNQSYVVLQNATAAGEALDDLLCQPPKHGRS